MKDERVVVGVAGADGLAYAAALLEALREAALESHLVIAAHAAAALGPDLPRFQALADRVHAEANQAARISSGSFLTRGMVVVPCDSASLASIALGLASNLVYRAADVTVKEQRPLVVALARPPAGDADGANAGRLLEVPNVSVLVLEGAPGEAVSALLAPLRIGHELAPA